MQFLKYMDRVSYMNKLIRKESTGSPEEFAERLHISRSHLYNLLEELKEHGADIQYSRSGYTFFYANDFNLKIDIRALCGQEEKIIFAGFLKKKSSVRFFWTEYP